MNDTYLQLLLARKLSDKIHAVKREDESGIGIFWIHFHCEVCPTEWLEIVRMVEETLTKEQQGLYVKFLTREYENSRYFNFGTIHKSWQQRATALHEIGVI